MRPRALSHAPQVQIWFQNRRQRMRLSKLYGKYGCEDADDSDDAAAAAAKVAKAAKAAAAAAAAVAAAATAAAANDAPKAASGLHPMILHAPPTPLEGKRLLPSTNYSSSGVTATPEWPATPTTPEWPATPTTPPFNDASDLAATHWLMLLQHTNERLSA